MEMWFKTSQKMFPKKKISYTHGNMTKHPLTVQIYCGISMGLGFIGAELL